MRIRIFTQTFQIRLRRIQETTDYISIVTQAVRKNLCLREYQFTADTFKFIGYLDSAHEATVHDDVVQIHRNRRREGIDLHLISTGRIYIVGTDAFHARLAGLPRHLDERNRFQAVSVSGPERNREIGDFSGRIISCRQPSGRMRRKYKSVTVSRIISFYIRKDLIYGTGRGGHIVG